MVMIMAFPSGMGYGSRVELVAFISNAHSLPEKKFERLDSLIESILLFKERTNRSRLLHLRLLREHERPLRKSKR